MSNGTRSTQRDRKYPTNHTHTIPEVAIKKIGRVNINYWPNNCILGFSFFDKDGALLWEIGWNSPMYDMETVVLEKNEVIVAVVAKLLPGYQSAYTDF